MTMVIEEQENKCTATGKTFNDLNNILDDLIEEASLDNHQKDIHNLISKLVQESFNAGSNFNKPNAIKDVILSQDTTNHLLMEIQTLLRDRLQ